ncbi:MAG: hypothetical protein NTW95_02080 [Candidatus Aminicenantes bacterium]|nr:hypothetical protein [Candidatus Aminicenantes bacterium]
MITEQEIDRGMATLKIIWLAMLVFLVGYAFAGRMIAPGMTSTMSREAFGMLRTALYALGFAALIASRFVKRMILAGKGHAIGQTQTRPPSVLQRYTSAVIASLAMSESVGMYGLVLFLLGKDETDLYLLLGISALAMVYHRPKREELASLYQERS